METNTVPIEILKEYLFYDAKTGEFYWLKAMSNKIKSGSQAGYDNGNGYRRVTLCGKRLRLHRVAWAMTYGEWPKDQIDHIDGVKDNNCISNLREATHQENEFNRKASYNGTSRFKGVHWDKRIGKWRTQATFNRQTKYLGLFESELEAACAYVEFAQAHHGEYLHLPTVSALR